MNSRENILTEVARWLDDFNDLEILVNAHQDYKFAALTIELAQLSSIKRGDDKAKYAAGRAREILGLKEKEPIRDITGLLEKCGIKVYPLNLVSDGFFGLSVAEDDGGPAIIVNVWERISVERWIFSTAHELGHLLLHLDTYNVDECVENKVQEREADVFASHFLMPEKAFIAEWNEAAGLFYLDRVFKTKRIFQVSYKTVLYRLNEITGDNSVWGKFYGAFRRRTGKTLGKTDEPEALAPDTFRQSPEVLRAHEPDTLSPSDFLADRLSRLVRQAIEQDEITMSRGAEILGKDLAEMREIVSLWV